MAASLLYHFKIQKCKENNTYQFEAKIQRIISLKVIGALPYLAADKTLKK